MIFNPLFPEICKNSFSCLSKRRNTFPVTGYVNASIEILSDSLRSAAMKERRFISDSLSSKIYREYVNPKDAVHTERRIEITKKYGFPDSRRIRKYYFKKFSDPEFNPYIILAHAPKPYVEELKLLMKTELEEGRIDRCTYGHMLG